MIYYKKNRGVIVFMKNSDKKTYYTPSLVLNCSNETNILRASPGIIDFNPNWVSDKEGLEI